MFDKRAGISPVSRRKKVVEVARAVLEPPMQSKRCWEGLLTFPRPQTHLGGHQSPPRPLFPCEVAQAIISGAILGLLPNHLEYLIRGEAQMSRAILVSNPTFKKPELTLSCQADRKGDDKCFSCSVQPILLRTKTL